MNTLNIRYKLLYCFLGIALLSLPYNIYLILNFSRVVENFLNVTDVSLPSFYALLELKISVFRINSYVSNFNHSVEKIKGNENTPTQIGAAKDQLFAYLEETTSWLKIYQEHQQSNQASLQLEKLKNDLILKALTVFNGKEKKIDNRLQSLQKMKLENWVGILMKCLKI